MSAASISRIHVTNSTGLSLNDRFTALSSLPEPVRAISSRRSRSLTRGRQDLDRALFLANERLSKQQAIKNKLQAALKLKRRSLRRAGVMGAANRRGSVNGLRVAVNGRSNALTNVATRRMADNATNGMRGPLRRSNSIARRIAARRPIVGGAAERIAAKRIKRLQDLQAPGAIGARRRRSRSRVRVPENLNVRGRSQSRGRRAGNVRRERSRSRGRNAPVAKVGSIKERLGVVPGNSVVKKSNRGRRNRSASGVRRRGGASRMQGRLNTNAKGGGRPQQSKVLGARTSRPRARSATRNTGGGRSRSRTRRGTVGQQKPQQRQPQQQQRSGAKNITNGRRGRSQQRNVKSGGVAPRNGNRNRRPNGKPQQQRGRSSSRGTRSGRGGRNIGNSGKPNKDDLDKELDQYMATTKTENDIEFLFK